MLTRQAINAPLKTLEEPPAHVKFIFATTAVNRLPETVQSRCQRFDFKNISVHDIEKRLSDICKAEGVQIDTAALHMIARHARGGLRDSQSVLDQLLSFCKDKISLEDVNFVLGCIDEDKILGMFDSFVKKDASTALTIVDTILNEGKTSGEFIDQLLSCIRDLLIFSSCGQDIKWAEFNTTLVQRFGKSFSSDTLMQRILLEMAVIKLCRMESIGSLNEIVDRIASLENSLIHLSNETKGKKKEFAPAQKSLAQQMVSEPPPEEYRTIKNEEKEADTLPDEKSRWEKILVSIQSKKKSPWALLKEGRYSSGGGS